MNTLQAVIDRFEEGKAVIKFDDGQVLIFDKNLLPDSIQSGDTINFSITTDSEKTSDKQQQAKNILNQILKESQ